MRLHLEAVMNRNNCELLFTENLREWYRNLKLYGLQSQTSGRNVLKMMESNTYWVYSSS
jgi:hypothetical protein